MVATLAIRKAWGIFTGAPAVRDFIPRPRLRLRTAAVAQGQNDFVDVVNQTSVNLCRGQACKINRGPIRQPMKGALHRVRLAANLKLSNGNRDQLPIFDVIDSPK